MWNELDVMKDERVCELLWCAPMKTMMRLYGELPFPSIKKCKCIKQKENGSYNKMRGAISERMCVLHSQKRGKKKKTNKNCNNCSTKDLVITLLIFLRRKTLFFFYKPIRGRQQFIHPLRVCTVANKWPSRNAFQWKEEEAEKTLKYIHTQNTHIS